ncbi:uncharacterized protein LOC128216843 [Mya arenaria]|uniref:uncharacterized protein LOC128216843 n=1 Tax=Mya arenaria TaxID=6604 RepID=UPI0022E46AB0|nr:uncharacterized protein LOC128216843 [Mya arenaria]
MGRPKEKSEADLKRAKAERARMQRCRQVNIRENISQWNEIKLEYGFQHDGEVAKFLIDSYKESEKPRKKRRITSTPLTGHIDLPGLSGTSISSVTSDRDPNGRKVGVVVKTEIKESRQPPEKKTFASFEEIGSEKEAGEEYDSADETYVPSTWEMSIWHTENKELPTEEPDEVEVEEDLNLEVHDIEIPKLEEDISDETPHIQKLKQLSQEDIDGRMFLVSESCLLPLLSTLHLNCNKCKGTTVVKLKKNGSGVFCDWVCSNNHIVNSWSSQPLLRNSVMLGDTKLSTAITLSGNNYTKIALLFRFMNIGVPTKSTFNKIQTNCTVPTVDDFWTKIKAAAREDVRGQDVVVSGNGQMDSPGYCAKYCTYTVMDQKSKKIVAMEIVDKRECQLKAGLMEATGFKRALTDLQNTVNVTEVVTDAHPQISSIMRKQFPSIIHSWDMWHGAKTFSRKLCAASQEKGNDAIKPWIGPIINHFFYSAETCCGDDMLLKTRLVSVLNHVSNRHEWGHGGCNHGPLTDGEKQKEWINPTGIEMETLEKIITAPRFLNTMKYYVTCQTTSELESFNNHILMYVSKRHAYSYDVYKCRCQIAAIDYMKHLDRPYRKNKKGSPCSARKYSKSANCWSVQPLKVAKDYTHIPGLMKNIINLFCMGEAPMLHPAAVKDSHPS